MKIHTIGDSHSTFGWRKHIIKHHMGPLLCYTFGIQKLNKICLMDMNIEQNDTVIFCLGEIDCRCHVQNHINDNHDYKDVINKIIFNYFEAINVNVELLNIPVKIFVYNVVPPIKKSKVSNHKLFQYTFASDEDRQKYVLYFNMMLKEYCNIYEYGFFDIYDHYTDEDGFLKDEISDDSVHIIEGSHIQQFIDNNIIC